MLCIHFLATWLWQFWWKMFQNTPLDLQLIWSHIDTGVIYGRNRLVKLAMHVFTIITNSAGCEQVFSNFGITHTMLCNKLNAEKVHKSSVIGMEIKWVQCDNGLAINWKKCKFGDEESTGTEQIPSPDDCDTDLTATDMECCQYTEILIQQAQASQQINTQEHIPAETLPPSVSGPCPIQPQSPTAPSSSALCMGKTQNMLANLFNYDLNSTVGEGLEFYWPGSIKNLEDDLLVHNHAAAEANSGSPPSESTTVIHLLMIHWNWEISFNKFEHNILL